MIQELNDKIKEKLNILQWNWKPLQNIFDYHTISDNGFPYLSFELADFEWSQLDECSNERIFNFDIIIYNEINNINTRNKSKETIYKLLDEIINLFDKENNFWLSYVKNILPIWWTIEPVMIWKWKAFVWLIKLQIETFNSI